MRERVAIMRENVRWVVTSAPDWFSHLSEVSVGGGSPLHLFNIHEKGGLETPRVTLIGLSSGSERFNHFTINLIEQCICSSILYIFPEIAIELWILFLIIFCDKIKTFFIIFCNYVPHTTIFRCRERTEMVHDVEILHLLLLGDILLYHTVA